VYIGVSIIGFGVAAPAIFVLFTNTTACDDFPVGRQVADRQSQDTLILLVLRSLEAHSLVVK